jgi:hypothetical protein
MLRHVRGFAAEHLGVRRLAAAFFCAKLASRGVISRVDNFVRRKFRFRENTPDFLCARAEAVT